MNPTEKEPVSIEREPAWIRDAQAAPVGFHWGEPPKDQAEAAARLGKMVAEICEGEKICCEYCGASFALWPLKEWADHQIVKHGENMTLQIRAGNALLCDAQLNPAIQAIFEAQFSARVSMRVRAWKLGHMRELEAPKPKGVIELSN